MQRKRDRRRRTACDSQEMWGSGRSRGRVVPEVAIEGEVVEVEVPASSCRRGTWLCMPMPRPTATLA